jgi:hypothetical protein
MRTFFSAVVRVNGSQSRGEVGGNQAQSDSVAPSGRDAIAGTRKHPFRLRQKLHSPTSLIIGPSLLP